MSNPVSLPNFTTKQIALGTSALVVVCALTRKNIIPNPYTTTKNLITRTVETIFGNDTELSGGILLGGGSFLSLLFFLYLNKKLGYEALLAQARSASLSQGSQG